MSLLLQVETTFHKTTLDMVRKKINIPIWLIIVSVVSAFLVLLVIVAILIKVNFAANINLRHIIQRLSASTADPDETAPTLFAIHKTCVTNIVSIFVLLNLC